LAEYLALGLFKGREEALQFADLSEHRFELAQGLEVEIVHRSGLFQCGSNVLFVKWHTI
jgi:molybdopterin synthase catalytic subunit